jgi:uncharacterized protein RhaS with RHS repeats
LYYYGARWYDPSLGRFTQPDTLVPNPGNPADFDRYAYVRNNPLKYNDPTGHQASCMMDKDGKWNCNPNSTTGSRTLTIDLRDEPPPCLDCSAWDVGLLMGGMLLTSMAVALAPVILPAIVEGACIDGNCTNEVNAVSQLSSKSADAVQAAQKLTQVGLKSREASSLVDQIARASVNNNFVSGGQTILGSYPEYINYATSKNATYFNMPGAAWNTLAAGGQEYVWTVNQRFLDYAVKAGQTFVVKLGEGKSPGHYLQQEIDYLMSKGYVWLNSVVNGTLVPGQ